MKSETVSIKEACEYLNVTPKTLRKWLKMGLIKSEKAINNRVTIDKASMEHLLKNFKQK